MKLMHVDSSAKGARSNSRALSRYFVDLLRDRVQDLEVDYLDITVNVPPHVTEAFAVATYTPPAERTDEMRQTLVYSDDICRRLLEADALLFAMPMYNWTVPSTFKAFIDTITRGELTYINSPSGAIGQLTKQKVLFITTRGADLRPGNQYSGMDALTLPLKTAFKFLGVTDPSFVDAQPLQFANPEARAEAFERAKEELTSIASEWAESAAKSNNQETMQA